MYNHRKIENTAQLTRQGLTLETQRNHGDFKPMVHDMLALSSNPELTPGMPLALFHVQPVASKGLVGSVSSGRL